MSPLTEPTRIILRNGWQPMDPDAAAYIAAVETADGQALEEKVKIAIDNFVLGCKSDGIWDAIKASCILAGARTLSGALVPLAGAAPTNFNFVAGDYNRKTGLVGNGSTKYLNSNRNNNADPRDSNHNAVFLTSSGSGIYMGSESSASGTNVLALNLSRNRNFSFSTDGGLGAAGFNGMARSAGANYRVRDSGVNTTIAIASQSPASSDLFVFARHTSNNPNSFTNARLAFYSIGESLDLALLDARVTDLINAIGVAIP